MIGDAQTEHAAADNDQIGMLGRRRARAHDGGDQSRSVSAMQLSRISKAVSISVRLITSGGLKVNTLPRLSLKLKPRASARYSTASAASWAGALGDP